MINISANGDLQITTPSLTLFSDSTEKDFLCRFDVNDENKICITVRDKIPFCDYVYVCLGFFVKSLPDFYYEFILGDFAFESYNAAHHEEEND